MNWRRSLATAGLVGLLAVGGCGKAARNERKELLKLAHDNTCLLNNNHVSPLKLNFEGKEIEVEFEGGVNSGCSPCLHYKVGKTDIWYFDSFTEVQREGQKIYNEDIISSAEDYSRRLLNTVLKNQEEMYAVRTAENIAGARLELSPSTQPFK